MKKITLVAFAALTLAACGNDANDHDNDNLGATDTLNTTGEVGTVTTDTSTTLTTTGGNNAYAPGEGDVRYTNNEVMVYRNGQWVEADNDITLGDGTVVRRNGRVVRDGNEIELEEGEAVDKTGRFFDRAGNAIENAWDDTKRGVKKAGKAIGNAAEKAGNKVEDAVDGNDRNDRN